MDKDGSNQIKLTNYSSGNIYETANIEDIHSENQKILYTQTIHDPETHETNYTTYTMNIYGEKIKCLNNTAFRPFYPKFSIDGLFIAFDCTDIESTDDLYIMKNDGSNIRNLTNDNDRDWYPHFISNSDEIIYKSEKENQMDIYKINFDGSNKVKLTTQGDLWGGTISVSKDGSKIVYISSSKIYIIDSDGSNNELLYNGGICYTPMISDDNSKVAFVSWSSAGYDIKVLDIEKRSDIIVANTLRPISDYWRPDILFTPDNDSIIFTRYYNDNMEIFIVDIDGNNLQNLTNSTFDETLGQIYLEY
jgi:TolB protein